MGMCARAFTYKHTSGTDLMTTSQQKTSISYLKVILTVTNLALTGDVLNCLACINDTNN